MEEKPFFFRLHEAGGKTVLAACDAEIMGKVLKHGDVDFEVDPSFYGRQRASAGQIVEMCRRTYNGNFIGKRIVEVLIENGIVGRDCALMIEGIPHVMTADF